MATKISQLKINSILRIARKRGPTSSEQMNDTVQELVTDFASIHDGWNNSLEPLLGGLPDGTTDSAIDAFTDGLGGDTLYLKPSSTASLNTRYWNAVKERPYTVFEQFQLVYTSLDNLTLSINEATADPTAADIEVTDTAENFDGTNVESVLAELANLVDQSNLFGTGTQNRLIKWIDTNEIGDSSISDTGSLVTIDTATIINGRLYNDSAVLNVGASATSNHSLGTNDLLVGGQLEAAGNVWFEGDLTVSGTASFGSLGFNVGQELIFDVDVDSDDSLRANSDGEFYWKIEGTDTWFINSSQIGSLLTNGGSIANVTANESTPVFLIDRADSLTGLGGRIGANEASLIAGGTEVLRAMTSGIALIPTTGQLKLPSNNDPAAPTLGFGDGNTGLYEAADVLSVTIAGNLRWLFNNTQLAAQDTSGPALLNVAATETVPSVNPDRSDSDTGIGSREADVLTLIAGGVKGIDVQATAGAISNISLNSAETHVSGNFRIPTNFSLYLSDDDQEYIMSNGTSIRLGAGGNDVFTLNGSVLSGFVANSAEILGRAAGSSTVPQFRSVSDTNTGLSALSDHLYLITSGVMAMDIGSDQTPHLVANLVVDGQIYQSSITTSTPAGTTQTIDWNNGAAQTLDLESASGDVTVSFNNHQVGASYVLKIIQDSAIARNVIWPDNVKWQGGSPPTITTTLDAIDIVSLFFDGLDYYANIGQDYS